MKKRLRRVILATLPSGAFGSAEQTWQKVDTNLIVNSLMAIGLDVSVVTIDKIAELDLNEADALIYTAIEDANVKAYLQDVLYFAEKKTMLVPKYEFLMALDNKGYQELYKKEYNIGNIKGEYRYDLEAYEGPYPVVYKRTTGAGSSGVHLMLNTVEKARIWRADFRPNIVRRIITYLRRLKLNKKEFGLYYYHHKGYRPHVCQEYIEGLNCDYKVLVFGGQYYVLKRYVRKNDFRASGSGNFDSSCEAPIVILDFASEIYEKFDVPYVSLDIALSENGCHLIEYQALNFGPTTLTRAKFHYSRTSDGWKRTEGPGNLSESYAGALVDFINRKFENLDPAAAVIK